MIKEFLLLKDKKENREKALAQKQECGCPSLQPSLRSHTHAFFATAPASLIVLSNLIDYKQIN
jgi:hypothetical protein